MRSLLVFVLAMAWAVTARAGEIEYVTWESLPRDCKVVHRAASWEALAKVAKPTMVHHRRDGEILFIWTGKNEAGKRFFKVATARKLHVKGQARETVIVSSGGLSLPNETVPLTTMVVLDHKRNEKQLQRREWARELSMHKELGTLYEIAFYSEPCCCGAVEQRLLVMHSPKKGWQALKLFDGDMADDVSVRTADAEVKWTPGEYMPFKLTVRYREMFREGTDRAFFEEQRYGDDFSGPDTTHYVEVKAGDTFSQIVKDLVDATCFDENARERALLKEWIAGRIKAANALKSVDVIKVGQRLAVPSGVERAERLKDISGAKGAT